MALREERDNRGNDCRVLRDECAKLREQVQGNLEDLQRFDVMYGEITLQKSELQRQVHKLEAAGQLMQQEQEDLLQVKFYPLVLER